MFAYMQESVNPPAPMTFEIMTIRVPAPLAGRLHEYIAQRQGVSKNEAVVECIRAWFDLRDGSKPSRTVVPGADASPARVASAYVRKVQRLADAQKARP